MEFIKKIQRCRLRRLLPLLLLGSVVVGIDVRAEDNDNVIAIYNNKEIKHNDDYPQVVNYINNKESIERFNRGIGGLNKFAAEYLIKPVAVSWATIMPNHGIQCLERFFDNIMYPKRVINSVLQADWDSSGDESLRFLTNTTIGLAGFYDPAQNWYDIEPHSKDFGQTLAKWGVNEGTYMTIPLMGASTVRDGSGKIIDSFLDPTTYLSFYSPGLSIAVGSIRNANTSANRYYDIDVFHRSFADSYIIGKMFFYAQRNLVLNELAKKENFIAIQKDLLSEDLQKLQQSPEKNIINRDLVDVNIVNYKSQGVAVDTLRYLQFTNQNDDNSIWNKVSLWNSDFSTKKEERAIEIVASRPRLPYILWEQYTSSSPIAYVIPGIGAGVKSKQLAALAKILYKDGYSVVVMPNTLNWEFVNSTLGNWLPGYLVEDCRMITKVVKSIQRDLKVNKNIRPTKSILLGISLGGTQALYLAALQKQHKTTLKFDRYVAVNPAVDIHYSMQQMDKLNNVWKTIEREKQLSFLSLLAMKYGMMATKDVPPVPITFNKNMNYIAKQTKKELTKKEQIVLSMQKLYKGAMPFTPREAVALLSLNGKQVLVDVLYMIHQYNNALTSIPVVNRSDYKEFYSYAIQWNYEKYLNEVLLPFYQRKYSKNITKDKFLHSSNLVDYTKDLVKTKNIFVFHTSDDFLVSKAQKLWLKKTFKGNSLIFSNGGHLGEMNTELFQMYLSKVISVY